MKTKSLRSYGFWITALNKAGNWKRKQRPVQKVRTSKYQKQNKKTKQNSAGELENAEYPLTYDLH